MTFTGTSSPTDKKAEMVQGDIVWRISEAREGTFNFGLFRAIYPRLQEFHHHRKMSGNRLEGRRDHEKAKALSPYSKGRPKEFSSLAAAEVFNDIHQTEKAYNMPDTMPDTKTKDGLSSACDSSQCIRCQDRRMADLQTGHPQETVWLMSTAWRSQQDVSR